MSPVFTARRRAEEFDALVEGTSTRELHDTRTVELAELVGTLRSAAPVEARPAFVADLRERLMAEAATALVPSATGTRDEAGDDTERRLTLAPRRTTRDRRIAAAVGGFAIVGATTSMAVAAQTALPGDTLYPLKRAIENAQTGFSVSDNQKGSNLLANAQGRLAEVEELSQSEAARDAATAETIAGTLAEFSEQAGAASELLISDYEENGHAAAIAELRDFTGSSMDALAGLESVLPEGARAALIQAAQLLTQIDAEAAALCTVCGGEGISIIPPFAVKAVEDVLGGLVGALTTPASTQAASEDRRGDSGRGQGKDRGGQGKAGPGGGQAVPTDTPTLPPVLGGGQQPPATTPSGQPSTLGDVIGGLLGGTGGNGGAGNGGKGSGSTTTSAPTTLPEVIEDVLGGVGDLVGGLLLPPPPKGTQAP